jgi:hypothetical protein
MGRDKLLTIRWRTFRYPVREWNNEAAVPDDGPLQSTGVEDTTQSLPDLASSRDQDPTPAQSAGNNENETDTDITKSTSTQVGGAPVLSTRGRGRHILYDSGS